MHVKYLTDLDVAQGYTQYKQNEEIITNVSNIHDFRNHQLTCVQNAYMDFMQALFIVKPQAVTSLSKIVNAFHASFQDFLILY